MIENEAKVKIRLDIEKAKEQLGELQKQSRGSGDGGDFTEKAIEARIKERKRWAKEDTKELENEIKEGQKEIEKLKTAAKYALQFAINPASIASSLKERKIIPDPIQAAAELWNAATEGRRPNPRKMLSTANEIESELSTAIAVSAVAGGGDDPYTRALVKVKAGFEALEPTAQMVQTVLAGERYAHSPVSPAHTAHLTEHFYRANRKMSEYKQMKGVVTMGDTAGVVGDLSKVLFQDAIGLMFGGNYWQ